MKGLTSFLAKTLGFLEEREKNLSLRVNHEEEKRLRLAIDAAKRYIMVNERTSPYDKLGYKKRKRYLRHFKRRFLHYGN